MYTEIHNCPKCRVDHEPKGPNEIVMTVRPCSAHRHLMTDSEVNPDHGN